MGAVTLVKDTPGVMTPSTDFIDSGWVISGGLATHFPCNPGYIINNGILGLVVGNTYKIEFEVTGWVSGIVQAFLGTTAGTARGANGKYSQEMVCAANTVLKFYSNGQLTIGNAVIFDDSGAMPPVTIAFSERAKLWVNYQSGTPEIMARFGDELFMFKNGAMYHQDTNSVRNNFFGEQFPSRITFYMNTDPASIKLFHNMIIESNRKWALVSCIIKPYPGKPFGMQSRIKLDRFKELQGIFFADFLRNMLDPGFDTEIAALLRGEELRGRVMEITIENNDTEEVTLFAVDVKFSRQNLTP